MLLDAALIVGGLGALLLGGLGVFVATLRPRTRANVAFAGFAISLGLAFVSTAMIRALLTSSRDDAPPVAAEVAFALAFTLAALFLTLVAFWFPRPFDARERRAWIAPAALAFAYLAFSISGYTFGGGASGALDVAVEVSGMTLFAAEWFALFVFAARFRLADDASARSRYVVASAGIALLAAHQTGIFLMSSGDQFYAGAFNAVICTPLVGVWLRNARRPPGAAARNVAILIPAAMLVGMVLAAREVQGGGGVMRALSVVIFSYGILKHQLLGIDLQLRWTISKGTLAAAFVGAFFVASEIAQEFFAGSTGSTYWGIAAAGALLFAIAPIQRAADRLANAATGVRPPAQMLSDERLALYREQARLAWADGNIGRRERMMLNHLRRELGLAAEAAERAEEDAAAMAAR